MLRIADQFFPIESSEFLARVSVGEKGWHVAWNIEFRAQEKEVNGVRWEPHLAAHAFSTQLGTVGSLSGSTYRLEDCDEDEEPMFLLYVFEHEPVQDVRLTFGEWKDTKIDFMFTGVANVYADEKYGESVPIEVSLALPFDGVVVDEGKIEKAIEKFSMFFDQQKFNPPESRGVGYGYIFRPVHI